jgi:tRNA-splicing ligase RtcB
MADQIETKAEYLLPINEIESEALNQIKKVCAFDCVKRMAIMPDVQTGYFLVIGGVALVVDQISPSMVGYDIGCFTSDTKVQLTDGRQISFRELIEEHKILKRNYTYSKTKDGDVVISEILNPRKTKTVDKLIVITLDNGKTIKCTLDHIFYELDGSEIKAENLRPGISLLPFYMKKDTEIPDDMLDVPERYKLDGYDAVWSQKRGKYIYSHYLADDFNKRNGVYSESFKNFVRHHIDFNKTNNNPSNISRCLWKDHFKLHNKDIKHNKEKGKYAGTLAHKTYPEMYSKMASSNMKKLHKNPDFAKRHKERARKTINLINADGRAEKAWKYAGERGRKFLKNADHNFIMRQKLARIQKVIFKLRDNGHYITKNLYNECKNTFYNYVDYNKAKRIIIKAGFTSFRDLLDENYYKKVIDKKYPINHKVISTKIIDVEPTDVYCLTINNYHNFALASGVFVHNCGMCFIDTGIKTKFLLRDKRERVKVMNYILDSVPVGFNQLSKENVYDKFISASGDKDLTEKVTAKAGYQLGTLGGGNHFIELGENLAGNVCITVHSGSRKPGWTIADYYMKRGDFFDEKSTLGRAYIHDMNWAMNYALNNRRILMVEILLALGLSLNKIKKIVKTMINESHNTATKTKNGWIHRKGATPAEKDQLGIIPGNMGDGVAITIGLGNEKYLSSASHGAGRHFSRAHAKKSLSMDRFTEKMKGIVSNGVRANNLDESPDAYKNFEKVLAYQDGIVVKVIDRIRPLVNIKG